MIKNQPEPGQLRLVTVDEFEKMLQARIFTDAENVQLIEGQIVNRPPASDVLLIVEVADTSPDYDRTVKIPLYGRSGIAEAWLIDLALGVIEVYREPNPCGYAAKTTYATGDSLAPGALSDVVLSVDDILGAAA